MCYYNSSLSLFVVWQNDELCTNTTSQILRRIKILLESHFLLNIPPLLFFVEFFAS
jgi:hypothetical protein